MIYKYTMASKFILIKINKFERRNIVLKNVLSMLKNRKEIKRGSFKKYYEKISAAKKDDDIYDIDCDNCTKKYTIKYIELRSDQKITAVNKSFGLSDFLTSSEGKNRIVITTDIGPKALKQLREYKNTEIFLQSYFMIDLVEHDIIPKHELLSQNNKQDSKKIDEILESYNIDKKDLHKIIHIDPVALYYNALPGDIFRITRPNEASGYDIDYRLVVKGELYP